MSLSSFKVHEQINRMDWLAKIPKLGYFVEIPITYDRNIASNTQLYLPIYNACRESDANFTREPINLCYIVHDDFWIWNVHETYLLLYSIFWYS